MVNPLLYSEALNNGGDTISVSLLNSQRYLLMIMANNLVANPSLWIEDYAEQDYEAMRDDLQDMLDRLMNDFIVVPEIGYQQSVLYPAKWLQSMGGGSSGLSTMTINTNQMFGHYVEPAISGTANSWKLPVQLQPGEYQIRISYVRQTNSGILTYGYTDNDDVFNTLDTIDMHGSFLLNQEWMDQFTIDSDGCKNFIFKTPTKNAASTSYRVALTMIAISSVEL